MISLRTLIAKAKAGTDLSESESRSAVGQIMEGVVSDEEIKAWLLALREKGEALSEIVGAARAMKEKALKVRIPGEMIAVDTCGTGGDQLKTANISTLAALVAAACGVIVAKHGNRSVTSSCGSADLLEALGVAVDVPPEAVERCLAQTGFGFLFAPRFHPAMKAVAPIRKALGVPTIFNLLGPLTNPAGVRHQVVGVADSSKKLLYAQALRALGAVRALVVHGADGQDELSTTGPTEVVELNTQRDPPARLTRPGQSSRRAGEHEPGRARRLAEYTLVPETFGISRAGLGDLQGGSLAQNLQMAQQVLQGKSGPFRDAVVFNAAAALYVAGVAGDIDGGLSLASQALQRGKVLELLEKVKRVTQGKS